MAQITTAKLDFSSVVSFDYPPAGSFILAIDTADNLLKMMDHLGVVTIVGGAVPKNAVQLLGKITANTNTTADQLIALSGGSLFVITDIVTTNPTAPLTSTETIVGTGRTGTFFVGEVISVSGGPNSGNESLVYSSSGNNIVCAGQVSQQMSNGDVIVGATSTATMTISTDTYNATGLTNLEYWSGTSRTGNKIAANDNLTNGVLSVLVFPFNYLSNTGSTIVFGSGVSNYLPFQNTVSNSLYLSFGTALGRATTVDIYVYGYILN